MTETAVSAALSFFGPGGLVAAMAMFFAIPSFFLRKKLEILSLYNRKFLERVSRGEKISDEESYESLWKSIKVLFFQAGSVIVFISGAVVSGMLVRGTYLDMEPNFSDFHIIVIILCFWMSWLSNRMMRETRQAMLNRGGSSSANSQDGRRGRGVVSAAGKVVLLSVALLIAVSPVHIPFFIAFYMMGLVMLGKFFSEEERAGGSKD
jgi:hypothetical protein